jgi:hypothetical protein
MEPIELLNSEAYRELMRHISQDLKWAEYFLLINTCYQVIKHIPGSQEAYEQAAVDELLEQALANLGIAISKILPGGAREFQSYMPIIK